MTPVLFPDHANFVAIPPARREMKRGPPIALLSPAPRCIRERKKTVKRKKKSEGENHLIHKSPKAKEPGGRKFA